ncbi:hypothetical protein CYMTET_12846 [Cymbomonas tetramitiformis]|uniref:SWIM-type domain-containing protein n=1 Tax=Cymbomonas tetramitiformis TaxID=36881 RepID=A0AAE0GJN0_9CHLO|nr:hypothetical protein CYMTET_12846 [Cymbomonas tetramitiformis]
MSSPLISSPLRRLQTAVREYCYPDSHPAVISFDILEEWSDINLQGEGNPQFRPAFGSDGSDRTPLASKDLNARLDLSNPVTTAATCEPAAGSDAKRVKRDWVLLSSRASFNTLKEHRDFTKTQAIRLQRTTQSEYSRTYGCVSHVNDDGSRCPYAEKYQYNPQTNKWDVYHNGSNHSVKLSEKHVGVPLHWRKAISDHATANRGQPMLALHAIVKESWDGSVDNRTKFPSHQQVRNFVRRDRCPAEEAHSIDTVAQLNTWVTAHEMPSTHDEFISWSNNQGRADAFVVSYQRSDQYGPAIAMTCLILGENILREHRSYQGMNIFSVKADASFGKQQGDYVLIDMGTDGVVFEDNGRWVSLSDAKNKPRQSFYLYLYVFAKSESKFSYLVGLNALRKYGKVAFNIDLPISIVCGDPMRSLTAAALEIDSPGDLEEVISLKDQEHVRRLYQGAVLKHVPEDLRDRVIMDRITLESSFTLEMRKLIADVMKMEWTTLNLNGLIRAVHNFTHGAHIMFFRGASGIPGLLAIMQSNERGHKEDARYVTKKASHYTVLTETASVLLKTRVFKNRDTFSHSISNIYATPFLVGACALVSQECGETNFYLYPHRRHGHDFIYMNLTATGVVVSELRVRKFRQLIRGENPGRFFRTMDQVRKYSDDIVELSFNIEDPDSPVDGNTCSCKWFWSYKSCPHILAGYYLRDDLDIFGLMERAFPHNRPRTMKQKIAAEQAK